MIKYGNTGNNTNIRNNNRYGAVSTTHVSKVSPLIENGKVDTKSFRVNSTKSDIGTVANKNKSVSVENKDSLASTGFAKKNNYLNNMHTATNLKKKKITIDNKDNAGNKDFNFTLGKYSPHINQVNIKAFNNKVNDTGLTKEQNERLERYERYEEQVMNKLNDKTINLATIKDFEENEKKLKDSLSMFQMTIRKNEGAGINTLFKVRSLLLNWLKDSENDNLEYTKFMTEKKMKYLLKNKEKIDNKTKALDIELFSLKNKKIELEGILGEIYITYETEELTKEINQFANSWEIRSGKSKKMLEKFEEMKRMLPIVKEFNQIKEQESNKLNEKKECEKILKGSNQTLGFLSNYYKNLRNKINDEKK